MVLGKVQTTVLAGRVGAVRPAGCPRYEAGAGWGQGVWGLLMALVQGGLRLCLESCVCESIL